MYLSPYRRIGLARGTSGRGSEWMGKDISVSACNSNLVSVPQLWICKEMPDVRQERQGTLKASTEEAMMSDSMPNRRCDEAHFLERRRVPGIETFSLAVADSRSQHRVF